ncbi:signal transduction histidine kinase [Salinisphaera dokdonensis CL-ES53]|uniref:histidine kinase n=1 Tax=Salinisphaera dokdonensis CL-ES53 TaxID=1304272 RepID=A0ABV2AXA2_9GAMM
MTPTPGTALVRHVEDWRAITSLNVYRGLVAFGLVGLLLFGAAEQLFMVALPEVFRIASLLYLAQCGFSLFMSLSRTPALRVQVLLACAVDVAICTTLTFASTGVAGGLGMLLITPVAAAGMLLPARLATLIAACAAIGIVGQEGWRAIQFLDVRAEFVQAGILGSVFFITASVAHWLARRVRVSEAIAAERATEARDLATLNRHIIQQMDMGAVVVDGSHRVQLINDAAIRMLELLPTRPVRTQLDELSPALEEALVDWQIRAPVSNDVIRAGSHSLLPVFSRLGHGESASVLIFLEDAARQSEQAQQLKLVSIGRLSASIAHEIRNPLGAISHAGQLLAESPTLNGEDLRMLDIIHRHSRRIDNIINSVMGLSRRSQLSRRTLALSAWLYDTIDDYLDYNEDAPDFDIDEFDAALQVEFDPDHLRQVLFNLWDNAQRHARKAGIELTIRLTGHRNRSDRFCLDIIDNGPGIDPAILDQIMEPFFTTNREGTGLGLHIAGQLCDANGAQLAPVAHSAGACFRITFAHAPPAVAVPAEPPIQSRPNDPD